MLSSLIFGAGRPIVVLPGFGLDSALMAAALEPVFAGLPGWQRIYLDLPGAGGSAPGEPTSDAVLEAVQQTVTAMFGQRPFRLAGLSYGGYLALALADRLPDQVDGLLLICTGVKIVTAERDLRQVLPSAPEPGWLESVPEPLQAHFTHAVGLQTRAVGDRLAGVFAKMAPMHEDYLERLRGGTGYRLSDEPAALTPAKPAALSRPVTLIAGRRDRVAGYRDQFALLERYPQASYAVVADAGHYLPFERPELFATLALDWLARGESAGNA